MEELENPTRLGVNDKRHLWNTLIAMTDRLFFLNKFPVNQVDFALSCATPEVEAAWRLLVGEYKNSLSPVSDNYFVCNDHVFRLHLYREELDGRTYYQDRVFMNIGSPYKIPKGNRFQDPVGEWAQRQVRLEDQILRANKVIKSIVHSCNTVGQYKRVSPDLLTFLPEKYRLALKDYTKSSPYPAIGCEPEEIETTMATLAYAALQPIHTAEQEYQNRPKWGNTSYHIAQFPRTKKFDKSDFRRLEL